MDKKLVIDLATHLGWAIIEDGIITRSGNIDLSKTKKDISYVSSKKRKTFPKDAEYREENGYLGGIEGNKDEYNSKTRLWNGEWYIFQDDYWFLIKHKEITIKRTLKQQLQSLADFIHNMTWEDDEVIVEAPAVPFGTINISSLRKQFGLYSVVELVAYDGIKEEVTPNEWFSWAKKQFPEQNVFKQVKGKNKIDRKATSKLIANVIMRDIQKLDVEIKDDNEADAICLAYYIIKRGEN